MREELKKKESAHKYGPNLVPNNVAQTMFLKSALNHYLLAVLFPNLHAFEPSLDFDGSFLDLGVVEVNVHYFLFLLFL